MNNNVPLAFVCGAVTAAFLLRTNEFRRHKWSSNDRDWVCVTKSPILLTELQERVASPKAGAVVTFSGVTRDNFDGREVLRLEYEGFVPMAERELLKICEQMRSRWEIERIAIVHRLGLCPVGEASVVIAVSSAHRREALEAAQFAIDTLKATVPIWKKECYLGESKAWKENKEWHENRESREGDRR
mmetsp:Transcript_49943/g.92895  ORF Transcript_49943/g.92895 Transcript_49943/m.92895 type:complete len:187 (+) Transcript_49943:67-627(+)